jgi:guanylate kinase
MRAGEKNGIDYHFVSDEIFSAMVERGDFAEWAEVHDNRYGTAIATLKEAAAAGQDILLDIDCQGAAQLKKNWRQGVFIFVLPPSFEELQRRLLGRNTDSAEVIARRTANARDEVRQATWYDYLVINDDFALALEQLRAVIVSEGIRTPRVLPTVAGAFGL